MPESIDQERFTAELFDILTGQTGKVDWQAIWRTVEAATPEEWASLLQ